MTTGMTFFITDAGWRMPVWTRLTPDFHVPHAEPQLDRQAAAETPPYPMARAHEGHRAGGSMSAMFYKCKLAVLTNIQN